MCNINNWPFEEGDWISSRILNLYLEFDRKQRGIKTDKKTGALICISNAENIKVKQKFQNLNLLMNVKLKKDPYNDVLDIDKNKVIYTGEGLEGHQKYNDGNKKLGDTGEAYYFINENGEYLYCGKFELKKTYTDTQPDINNRSRRVYQFEMKYINGEFPPRLKITMTNLTHYHQLYTQLGLNTKRDPNTIKNLIRQYPQAESYLKTFL